MFVPALINWATLTEAVRDDTFDLYVDIARDTPPAEHLLTELVLYQIPGKIDEHYVVIERVESGDHIEPEPFTEHAALYETIEHWFARHRLTSDTRKAKGGGFSCCP